MTYLTWRDRADRVLAELYDRTAAQGSKPTKQEVFDAYPFTMREYTPYKIWLEQVKRWERGEPLRRPNAITARENAIQPLPGQEALL